MNSSSQNDFDRNAATIDAEHSLRLIASLPAPVGIEERVKCGLQDASSQTAVIAWPFIPRRGWAQVSYLRAAAAAAIVLMVAGGGWGSPCAFRAGAFAAGNAVPQRIERRRSFRGGSKRTPKTVDGSGLRFRITRGRRP